MRIFIIHNFYQHAGGEDTVFRQEVDELSKVHQVEVYTELNKKGLQGACQFLSYPFNFSTATKISKAVQAFGPDIIHIHNLHYAIGPWVIRAIDKLKIPIVMTLHNYRLLCPSASLFHKGRIFTKSLQEHFPWTAVRKRVLDNSLLKTFITAFTYWFHRKISTWDKISRFIVLSDFAKGKFLDSTFTNGNTEQFTVRPNSINAMPLNDTRQNKFVYIGRLAEEKGILPLLNAIAPLQIPIDVYGSGPQQEAVEKFDKQFGHIHYKGFRPANELSRAIAQAGALIVPSICYEGMPMTIVEAYAQGTPVLASRIGILEEMVLPLYTGLLFDPFDYSAVQDTLREWDILDSAKKQEIGINCNAEYQKHYRLDKNMDKLLAIYSDVIASLKN